MIYGDNSLVIAVNKIPTNPCLIRNNAAELMQAIETEFLTPTKHFLRRVCQSFLYAIRPESLISGLSNGGISAQNKESTNSTDAANGLLFHSFL